MKLNLFLLSATALVNAADGVETLPIDLGAAANYVILAKSGISTVPQSSITGNIGVSPIAATAMTGFSLTMGSDTQHSTSNQVSGECHGASYGGTVAAELTVAVSAMEAAYTDAAGRSPDPDDARGVDFMGGALGGQSLTPGVYTFTGAVTIATDMYFNGGPDDIWIISTMGAVTLAAGMDVILLGGAQAKNIYWRGATTAAIGADASMAGIMLFFTDVLFATGSSLNGAIYSQTAVNLQMATIMTKEDHGMTEEDHSKNKDHENLKGTLNEPLKAVEGVIQDEFLIYHDKGIDPRALLDDLINSGDAEILYEYTRLNAFSVHVKRELLDLALNNIENISIFENQVMSAIAMDSPVYAWGVDRTDQTIGMDNQYQYERDGANVDVYILDTGIFVENEQFEGRASLGADFTGEGNYDGHGHGTHVAGTLHYIASLSINICVPLFLVTSDFRYLTLFTFVLVIPSQF
jgi:hypothetical protein